MSFAPCQRMLATPQNLKYLTIMQYFARFPDSELRSWPRLDYNTTESAIGSAVVAQRHTFTAEYTAHRSPPPHTWPNWSACAYCGSVHQGTGMYPVHRSPPPHTWPDWPACTHCGRVHQGTDMYLVSCLQAVVQPFADFLRL